MSIRHQHPTWRARARRQNSELLVGGRRMMTAREPGASPCRWQDLQGGMNTKRNWDMMRAGSRTTLPNRYGRFERRGMRGPYFQGAHGGGFYAFADGRGSGSLNHAPFNLPQEIATRFKKLSPPPPSEPPPPPYFVRGGQFLGGRRNAESGRIIFCKSKKRFPDFPILAWCSNGEQEWCNGRRLQKKT